MGGRVRENERDWERFGKRPDESRVILATERKAVENTSIERQRNDKGQINCDPSAPATKMDATPSDVAGHTGIHRISDFHPPTFTAKHLRMALREN